MGSGERANAIDLGRREFLKDTLAATAGLSGIGVLGGCAMPFTQESADTIVTNGRIATLDPKHPAASAIAIRGGTIAAVGSAADMEGLRGPNTQVIDAGGRAVIPGINDAHTHFIRGGLTYTNEVRWDGVPSLAEGMRRVREQARRTPPPHWVQVIGGWTWAQFSEKRFPTLEEINQATGDTPCMIMHLYDRAWINRAGLRALGAGEVRAGRRLVPHDRHGRIHLVCGGRRRQLRQGLSVAAGRRDGEESHRGGEVHRLLGLAVPPAHELRRLGRPRARRARA